MLYNKEFLFWSLKEFGSLRYRRGDAQGHPSWGKSSEPSQLQGRPGTGERASGRGPVEGLEPDPEIIFMCVSNCLCHNPLHYTQVFSKVLLNRQPGPSFYVGKFRDWPGHLCPYLKQSSIERNTAASGRRPISRQREGPPEKLSRGQDQMAS